MQFQVPQFIEVEDKIFGPLTFKQFVYVAGGAGAAYLFWRILPVYLSLPFIAGVGGLAAAVVLILGYRAHVGVFWKTQARMQQHRRYGPPPGLQSTQALLSLRTVASGQRVIFERDAAFPAPSPEFLYCAARPFLYPAVTERAWVGVLEPDGACPYDKYGYPPYFTGSPRALVTPVIPPGVSVVRVSKDAGAPGR